jgi:hypothetical protein
MFKNRAWHVALAGVLTATITATTFAEQGRPEIEQAIYAAAGSPLLAIGAPDALHAAQQTVGAAERLGGRAETGIIPAGTTVDRVGWDGAMLEVDLTFIGAGADWKLSTLDMTTLAQALGRPFIHDSAFAGVRVRARRTAAEAYGPLGRFVPVIPAPPEVRTPDADAAIPEASDVPEGAGDIRFGGSTSTARQPVGALTGVTVYASAGHGWTADADWFLQRPVDLGMNEDHGNLDQMNYFIHFARAAGATVVPMRAAGWQSIEIVLDNDDPGVNYTGAWSDSTGTKYYENGVTVSGVPYRFATAAPTESATARFNATITVSDYYPVFGFAIAGTNRVRQTYRVGHSGGVTETVVDHREVGNGWVWLGEYYFEAGGTAYVEVTNESPDTGLVIADAARWGTGTGDISRPGPGVISGYPRDEEAQRYWAHNVYGNNTVGFSSTIYDTGSDDQDDNVGTGARTAREMNQVPVGGVLVDRWKRIHLECHTNASGGVARGQICLITTSGSTSNQASYATILADEFDADMLIVDSEFEHSWVDRASPTFSNAYGAISTGNNSDEFDATIVELAFHDNVQDAELLRDPRVRRAMARACVHGIIRFLNTLPGSQVSLDFAPDTPRKPRVEDLGGGDVQISWQTPLADGARGDAATGYVIYQSTNGFGFGDPIVLGNVTSHTISGVAVSETHYYRIAATNAGGESMPTEVLAVRRPASGLATVLVVNGFDRSGRTNNPVDTFTHPVAYAGLSFERQQWRRSNAFNYIVEHAEALAASDIGFASTCNEAVADLTVDLNDYEIAVWILGTESTEDEAFDISEQTRVSAFLSNGGSIFVSGSELAYDLVNQGGGVSFAQNTLRVNYSAGDAGTFDAVGAGGGILFDIAGFDFDIANGAAYEVNSPDELLTGTGAIACLNYVGGTGGIAGIQYIGPTYNTVVFGFPFETITSSVTRADIMQRVITFLESAAGPLQFDFDDDGDVDNSDFNIFRFCFQGPGTTYTPGHVCLEMDGDFDFDVDLGDFYLFQQAFTGP